MRDILARWLVMLRSLFSPGEVTAQFLYDLWQSVSDSPLTPLGLAFPPVGLTSSSLCSLDRTTAFPDQSWELFGEGRFSEGAPSHEMIGNDVLEIRKNR